METKTGKIYEALAKINAEIVPIKKEKTNSFQGYKFRGIDDFYNMLQGLFAKNKVMCIPRVLKRETSTFDSAKGVKTFKVDQEMVFKMLSLEDGSFEEIGPLWGEAMDTSDKATNKSNSAAAKYALMMGFMVPTDDLADGDKEHPEVEAKSTQTKTLKVTNLQKAASLPEYKIANGIHKGKMLKDLGLNQIQEFLTKSEEYFEKRGERPFGSFKDDMNNAYNYLQEQAELKDLNA